MSGQCSVDENVRIVAVKMGKRGAKVLHNIPNFLYISSRHPQLEIKLTRSPEQDDMLSFVQHQLFISCVYITQFGEMHSLESVHVSRGSDPPEYLKWRKR
jgi:hypothetical protein